jgi:hypothetical protein
MKLGVCLKELGRDRKAGGVFHAIFRPDEDRLAFHYHLGIQFHEKGRLEEMAQQICEEKTGCDPADARASLELSLVNMGLLDQGAATWRDLRRTHRVKI